MKKEKLKKVLISGGLILAMTVPIVGCYDVNIEQSKLDDLINKGEQYVDTQNAIDYEKLAEELQKYLDKENSTDYSELAEELQKYLDKENSTDYSELSSKLQEYLDKENQLTIKDVKRIFIDQSYKLADVAMTNRNYTFESNENGIKEFFRIEYTSTELIKMYFYTENEEGIKTQEVYKEITPTTINTYVKDKGYKLYNSVRYSLSDTDLFKFTGSETAIYSNDSNITWDNVFGKIAKLDPNDSDTHFGAVYFEMDIKETIVNLLTSFIESPDEMFEASNYNYEFDGINHTVSIVDISFDTRDGVSCLHKSNSSITISNNSLGVFLDWEQKGEGFYYRYEERENYVFTFDDVNQNIIDFDKTGYQEVGEFYNNLINQE